MQTACLALLLWSSTAFTQQPKTDPPFAADFAKLKAAVSKLYDDLEEGFKDAKTEEAKEAYRDKAGKELYQQTGIYADKAFELVKPHVKEPAAVEVLVWILGTQPGSAAAMQSADLLIRHHLIDPRTLQIASKNALAAMPWTEKMLRALVAADLPMQDRGQALFNLAQCLQTEAEAVSIFKSWDEQKAKLYEQRYGKDHFAKIRAGDVSKLEAEAVKLFMEVSDNFGELKYGRKKLGDQAKSAIFTILNLGVGKTAPEISGEDIDGKPMKLSDYRGKVVVLDFWGHW
jgi:AhpC/TSA family